MKPIDNRQKQAMRVRPQNLPQAKKKISVQEARKYFRKKDHTQSPIPFWKPNPVRNFISNGTKNP
jgi:hypothetical protein